MEFTLDNLTYKTISTTDVKIKRCYIYEIGDIRIPETVEYKNKIYFVTSIGDSAFHNCSALNSITIPNSVTSIEDYTFSCCDNLKKVYLSKNTKYEENTFPCHTKLIFYEDVEKVKEDCHDNLVNMLIDEENIIKIDIEETPKTFQDITKSMNDLYEKKNKDYGNSFEVSLNKYGIISALTRISDKFNRLENIILTNETKVKDEKLEDTLLDLASYSVMTLLWLKNKKM